MHGASLKAGKRALFHPTLNEQRTRHKLRIWLMNAWNLHISFQRSLIFAECKCFLSWLICSRLMLNAPVGCKHLALIIRYFWLVIFIAMSQFLAYTIKLWVYISCLVFSTKTTVLSLWSLDKKSPIVYRSFWVLIGVAIIRLDSHSHLWTRKFV